MEDRLCGGVRVMRMRTTLLQREKIIELYWTTQKEENWGAKEMKEGGRVAGTQGERDIQKIMCGLHGHLSLLKIY